MKSSRKIQIVSCVALFILVVTLMQLRKFEGAISTHVPTNDSGVVIGELSTCYRDIFGRHYDHYITAVVPNQNPHQRLRRLTRADPNVFLEYDTPYISGKNHRERGSISNTELTYPPEAQNLFKRESAQFNGKTYTLRLRASHRP